MIPETITGTLRVSAGELRTFVRAAYRGTPNLLHQRSTRGAPNRRVVVEHVRDGVEYRYHATKGWRSQRIAPARRLLRSAA